MQVEEHIQVDVPPAEAFRFIADFSNLADWDPSFERSVRLDDGELGEGSRFLVRSVTGFELTYEITTFDPGRHVVLEGHGGGVTSIDDITFHATPDGTEVVWNANVDTPAPDLVEKLGTPVFKVVGKIAAAGMRRTLGS